MVRKNLYTCISHACMHTFNGRAGYNETTRCMLVALSFITQRQTDYYFLLFSNNLNIMGNDHELKTVFLVAFENRLQVLTTVTVYSGEFS